MQQTVATPKISDMKNIEFSQPKVKPLLGKKGKKDKYILLEDLHFKVEGEWKVVPEGFSSDGASIPRLFWSLIGSPFSPRFLKASIIHDYLYNRGYDRKKADKKFKELLEVSDVKSWRIYLMYHSVRMFGGVCRWGK
jgi:hypothetical protein